MQKSPVAWENGNSKKASSSYEEAGNLGNARHCRLLGETRELVSLGCVCSWELAKASSSYEEAPARAGASSGLDSYETFF